MEANDLIKVMVELKARGCIITKTVLPDGTIESFKVMMPPPKPQPAPKPPKDVDLRGW
jgi:hypothetical protein